MAQIFLKGVRSQFNDSNYLHLDHDSVNVVGGDLILKRAGSEMIRIGADSVGYKGHILPDADSTYNLGNNNKRWASIYADAISALTNVSIGGDLNINSDFAVLNKAQTAYIDIATRDTSGSEVVYHLGNLGDITLGTDSIASNINAVGDVLAFKVDSNENTGGTPNIQFKVGSATELTINGSSADFAGEIDVTTRYRKNGYDIISQNSTELRLAQDSYWQSFSVYAASQERLLINSTGATFAGDITVNGGDVNVTKQNDAPIFVLTHDGTNPGTSDNLWQIMSKVDYNGTHENWGNITHRTTSASNTRTELLFDVKSQSGNVLNALTLRGGSGTPTANFAGNVGIGGLDPDSSKALRIKSQSVSTQSSAIEVIQNGTGTNPIIRMGEKSTDGARLHMFDGGIEKIAFYTDGTDNHISAGNLGILGGDVNIPSGYVGRDTHNGIHFSTDDSIIFRVADTHRARFDSDGLNPYASGSYNLGSMALRWGVVRTNYVDINQSSTTDPALRLTDAGVANYDFIFPDTNTIKLETSTTSTKTFKLLNAGTGDFDFEASSATFTDLVTIGPGTTGSPYDSTTFVHVKGTTRSIVQQSSTGDAYYMFGDAAANNVGWIGYDHSTGNANIQAESSITLYKQTTIQGGSANGQLDITRNSGAHLRLQAQSSLARIGSVTNNHLQFVSNDTGRWNIQNNGHFVPVADASYDIGTSSSKVNNVHATTYYGDGSNLTGISVDGSNFVTIATAQTITGRKTFSNGIDVTGGSTGADIYINNSSPTLGFTDSNSYTDANDIYIVRGGGTDRLVFNWYDNSANTTTETFHIDSSGNASYAGDVKLADNKKIKFGAAPDYEIYHNNSTNVNHVSSLLDRQLSLNANQILLTNQANTTTYLKLESTGATILSTSGNPIFTSGGSTNLHVNAGSNTVILNNYVATSSNVNSTGDPGLAIYSGKRLGFDESGVRSWSMKADGGNLNVFSGDGAGGFNVSIAGGLITDLIQTRSTNLTANVVLTSRNFLVNQGTNNLFTVKGDSTGAFVPHKFAVKSTDVHANFDFYNDGTTYLNGTTTVDADLKISGTGEDTLIIGPQAAGSGTIIMSLNAAENAYEPLRFDAETFKVTASGSTSPCIIETSGLNTTFGGSITVNGTGDNLFYGTVNVRANKKFTSTSSSSGDYIRLYAGSGTGEWDIYGHGNNLRFSENSGVGGVLAVDTSVHAKGMRVTTRGTASAETFDNNDGDGIFFDFYNDGNPYLRHGSIIANSADNSAAQLEFYTTPTSGSATQGLVITSAQEIGIQSIIYHLGDGDSYFGFNTTDNFVIYTAAGKGFEMDSNRVINIGSTLQIPSYIEHKGDDDSYFGFNAADSWKLRLGDGDRMIVDTNDAQFNVDVQAPNVGLGAEPSSFGTGVPTLYFKGTNSTNGRAGAIHFLENDGDTTGALYSTNGADNYGLVLSAYQGSLKLATGSLTGTVLELDQNNKATFTSTVKATTYLINHTSAAGIGASLGDINSAELGPGYLSLSRDDTADAKQIVFEKNDVEHSYIQTGNDNLRIVAGSGKTIFLDTNGSVNNMWRFTNSGVFQWGAARGTLTWDSTYARVHASGTGMELHLGSGDDTDAVKIIGSNVEMAGNLSVGGTLTATGGLVVVDTTNLAVSDTLIGLNVGATTNPTNDCGIIIERGNSGDNACIIWDESIDGFVLGTTTNTQADTGAITRDAFISVRESETLLYSGQANNTFSIGRNANEKLQIYVDDGNITFTADQDSDGNATHNFTLNRTFEGTGANNFNIQKDGTDQFKLDTSANAYFYGKVSASVGSSNAVGLEVSGSNSSYTAASILNTGDGDAILWMDASNGDLTGGDYASIRQTNGLSLLLKTESASGGAIIFQPAADTALTLATDKSATFAGNVNIGEFTSSSTTEVNLRADTNISTKLGFFEDNLNHGFSLNYDAVANDFIIKRHNNSATGTDVLTLNRTDNNATFSGTVRHEGLVPSTGTDIDQIKEFSMTFQLAADTWTDTGIDGTDLATGTYMMQVLVDDYDVNGAHYTEYYSGTISWFATNTNSDVVDEIPVHRAGHAPQSGDVQFRTERTLNADSHDLMLQVKHNRAYNAALDGTTAGRKMIFKFRRLI